MPDVLGRRQVVPLSRRRGIPGGRSGNGRPALRRDPVREAPPPGAQGDLSHAQPDGGCSTRVRALGPAVQSGGERVPWRHGQRCDQRLRSPPRLWNRHGTRPRAASVASRPTERPPRQPAASHNAGQTPRSRLAEGGAVRELAFGGNRTRQRGVLCVSAGAMASLLRPCLRPGPRLRPATRHACRAIAGRRQARLPRASGAAVQPRRRPRVHRQPVP